MKISDCMDPSEKLLFVLNFWDGGRRSRASISDDLTMTPVDLLVAVSVSTSSHFTFHPRRFFPAAKKHPAAA